VRKEQLRCLFHARSRPITDAAELGQEIAVLHRGSEEGPAQRLVLHVEKLPALIVRQLPIESPLERHPNVLFCINGEGDAPLRIGRVDCEISFGPQRTTASDDLLFRDFVLPISTPENTRRISNVALRERLEGFPLLHLDFYKEDPSAPNWAAWIKTQRLIRTEPNRGIRFQRIKPALEAVRANAGLTICGLALLGRYIDDGTLSLPFPVSTGQWTDHAFQARFRPDALLRPQVKRFREWLVGEARVTRDWLLQHVESSKRPPRRGRAPRGLDAVSVSAVPGSTGPE
jgi:DNA-binding transcriptional LysR family regulator